MFHVNPCHPATMTRESQSPEGENKTLFGKVWKMLEI